MRFGCAWMWVVVSVCLSVLVCVVCGSSGAAQVLQHHQLSDVNEEHSVCSVPIISSLIRGPLVT